MKNVFNLHEVYMEQFFVEILSKKSIIVKSFIQLNDKVIFQGVFVFVNILS